MTDVYKKLILSSYLSSMRTQRSLKCRCRCFFCLFLLFFFSTFLSAFSSSSRLSAGRSMWGNRSSSRGRPSSSSLWGSSWRKGSRRGDSSGGSSDSGEAGLDDDLLQGCTSQEGEILLKSFVRMCCSHVKQCNVQYHRISPLNRRRYNLSYTTHMSFLFSSQSTFAVISIQILQM